MNRRLKIIKIVSVALALAVITLASSCSGGWKGAKNNSPEFAPGTLTITGNGVKNPGRYTLDELKDLQDAVASERFSTVNNVGTKSFFVGKGVQLSYLLAKAGMLDEAQTIKLKGSDGYTVVLTREQLAEQRFYYPGLMEGSEIGAREVPAVLAWEHREGSSDLSQARIGGLRLLIGQTGLSNVVVPAFVRDVALIEVSTAEAGRWEPVMAEPSPGKVGPGAGIVLSHPHLDSVKIYYTLDGSIPDEKSLIYNPSTTYFKPEMNLAITVDQDVTIKAIAVGFGKYNSQVAVFEYDI